MKEKIQKFIRMSNGQYMKISFFSFINNKVEKLKVWNMDIIIGNSKRQCNDCLRKTEKSPKAVYGRSTGNKLGIEPFRVALKELLELENTINDCMVQIKPATERLEKVYSYLERYGYKKEIKGHNDNEVTYYYKMIER